MQSEVLRTFILDSEVWEKAYAKAHVKELNKDMLAELRSPKKRLELLDEIVNGSYEFAIPHKAEIPKPDSKEMRVVVVCGNRNCKDRLVLAVLNECLFKVFGQYLVSERSKAYQTGLSTGKVVKELPKYLCKDDGYEIVKIDFTKYFDRVSKEVVFLFIDIMEMMLGFEHGTEPFMNLLRKMFSDDRIRELNGKVTEQWSGIRQGNPVSAFFANIVLKELDDYMSQKYPYYVRYSDDLICIGKDSREIISDIENIIKKYSVSLNKNKTDVYTKDDWFKFLGINCKRDMRSLSARRVKDFQKEILNRTVDKMPNITIEQATDSVCRYLYEDGGFSWATSVLPIVNVRHDIEVMDMFVIDCLRVVRDAKGRPHKNNHGSYAMIGTIGCEMDRNDYTLVRKTDNRYRVLRKENPSKIENYYSILDAWMEINMCRELYRCSVRTRKL